MRLLVAHHKTGLEQGVDPRPSRSSSVVEVTAPGAGDAGAAHDEVWDAGQVVVAVPSDPAGVVVAAVTGVAMLVWGVVGGLDYRGAATRYHASVVRYWSGGPIRRRLTPAERIPSVRWWRGFFWVLAAVSFVVLVSLPFGR